MKKLLTSTTLMFFAIIFHSFQDLNAQTISNVGIHFTKAIKLLNKADGSCTFEYGKLPNDNKFTVTGFWFQKRFNPFEKKPHPSPESQYVITLKGKLKFKVTDGSTFILEPGTVLISSDTVGAGHSWKLIQGKKWERIYIPIPVGTSDHFIKD